MSSFSENMNGSIVLTLGVGEVLVAHGVAGGLPAIVMRRADTPGEQGAPADGKLPKGELLPGSVCIRFANMQGALDHLDRLMRMMKDWEIRQAQAEMENE